MKKQNQKTEEIQQFILENVESHPGNITAVAASRFGISRQAVHRHVTHLLKTGLLRAKGATRDRIYTPKPLVEFSITLPLQEGLEEDKVWRVNIRPLMDNVPANILGICQYGFTEIVNNAIDHSSGTELLIQIKRTYALIEINIADNGIGIFTKIQQAFNLDDPLHAILELSKGKLTTDPTHHTGEGIFFTSRMFDSFFIVSGKLRFAHYLDKDWLLEDGQKNFGGTHITLCLNPKSARTTQQVFEQHTTGDDHSFSRTVVPVLLAAYGDENLISRSQAKRLLVRFERFKEIMLDFKRVESIGQAFADEIFRVFTNEHPNINIIPINANKQVEQMISRVTSQ